MTNKRILTSSPLFFSIVGTVFLASCASAFALSALQQQQAAYKQQFMQNTLQSTQQRKLAYQNQNAQASAQATAQVKEDLGTNKQNNANTNATQEQPAQPVSCDCYNMKDSNNLSNKNFYFDHTGLRANRITPPCKCLPPTDKELAASQKQPIQNTPISNVVNTTPTTAHPNFTQPTNTPATGAPTTNGKNKSGSGQFDIKYN